ncbi:MAG TPA: hypothetical protein VEB68_03835 [Croceibacterium sp.]|nr:hypothetical protein [Croceibacterium sp.]
MANEANVGGLLSETVALIGDTLGAVGLYVLVVGGLTAAGVALGQTETSTMAVGFGFQIAPDGELAGSAFDVAVSIVGVVAGYLLLARYLAARGRLQPGGSRIWAYIGMSILSAIAMVLGFLLVIVPGIILMVRWSTASGFLIGGREGVTDALGASWRATRGHSWPIFFAAIVLFIAAIVAGGAVGGLFGLMGELPTALASAFIEAAAGALFLAFAIGVYCRVHHDAAQLSEVFA